MAFLREVLWLFMCASAPRSLLQVCGVSPGVIFQGVFMLQGVLILHEVIILQEVIVAFFDQFLK